MQWSPDRNAGFSRSDPGRLYLPVIMDPQYGYQGVNVEAQMNSTASLLHWTRRMIHVRKSHRAFGRGEFTDLGGSNPSILSYLRTLEGAGDEPDVILCVNNLSRFPQAVRLDLAEFAGRQPVELTGGVPFPDIDADPYQLTLPGYGFYWLELRSPEEAP